MANLVLTTNKIHDMGLTLAEDKEFCYIYLLKKHFNGDTTALARTFALTRQAIGKYQKHWGEAVDEAIQAEEEGRKLNGPKAPSIRSLKERILIQISECIENETNPSNLANTYARLMDFQQGDDGSRNATSIADAVTSNLKRKGKFK